MLPALQGTGFSCRIQLGPPHAVSCAPINPTPATAAVAAVAAAAAAAVASFSSSSFSSCQICDVVSNPALLDAEFAIPSTFKTRSSATLPCSNLMSRSWNFYDLSTTRLYRASTRQLTIGKATAIGRPCMYPAELRACRAVCARRSLLNSATQRNTSPVATPASAGTNGSPARIDIPVRNRPALGGEQTSAHLVGQRHISTEQADCSTGTHSGLRSWPRSDGASEDAASIKGRLLLNHSAVKQVSPVRRSTCALAELAR